MENVIIKNDEGMQFEVINNELRLDGYHLNEREKLQYKVINIPASVRVGNDEFLVTSIRHGAFENVTNSIIFVPKTIEKLYVRNPFLIDEKSIETKRAKEERNKIESDSEAYQAESDLIDSDKELESLFPELRTEEYFSCFGDNNLVLLEERMIPFGYEKEYRSNVIADVREKDVIINDDGLVYKIINESELSLIFNLIDRKKAEKIGGILEIPYSVKKGNSERRVTSIDSKALYQIDGIRIVYIPESVHHIEEHALDSVSIAQVFIPSSVETIEDFAFSKYTFIFCELDSKPSKWFFSWDGDKQTDGELYKKLVTWGFKRKN